MKQSQIQTIIGILYMIWGNVTQIPFLTVATMLIGLVYLIAAVISIINNK